MFTYDFSLAAEGIRGTEGEDGAGRAPRGNRAYEDQERGDSEGARGAEIVLSYSTLTHPPFVVLLVYFCGLSSAVFLALVSRF